MAATFAEAKADYIAARVALAAALAVFNGRLVALRTAVDAFEALDPNDAGFDAAASAVKLRTSQYKNARIAVQAQRAVIETAMAECRLLAP